MSNVQQFDWVRLKGIRRVMQAVQVSPITSMTKCAWKEGDTRREEWFLTRNLTTRIYRD